MVGGRARDGHVQIVIEMAGLVWSLLSPEGNSQDTDSNLFILLYMLLSVQMGGP